MKMIRESFVWCVIICATDGSQDDEITRLKEGSLATKDRSCWESSSSSLATRNLTPIVIDDADVDSANPEILTVQEDEDDDEDDDVEIDI